MAIVFYNRITIQQWNQFTVKSLQNRMATEVGVQTKGNCSFVAKKRARDDEMQTEMETMLYSTDKKKSVCDYQERGEKHEKRRHFIRKTFLVDSNQGNQLRKHFLGHGDEGSSPTLLFNSSQDTTNHRRGSNVLPILFLNRNRGRYWGN